MSKPFIVKSGNQIMSPNQRKEETEQVVRAPQREDVVKNARDDLEASKETSTDEIEGNYADKFGTDASKNGVGLDQIMPTVMVPGAMGLFNSSEHRGELGAKSDARDIDRNVNEVQPQEAYNSNSQANGNAQSFTDTDVAFNQSLSKSKDDITASKFVEDGKVQNTDEAEELIKGLTSVDSGGGAGLTESLSQNIVADNPVAEDLPFAGDLEFFRVGDAKLSSQESLQFTDLETKTPNEANTEDVPVVDENSSPEVSHISMTMQEDGTLLLQPNELLKNISDADGDTLEISNFNSSNGTIVDNGDGTWTFIPNADYAGPAEINFIVSDGIVDVEDKINLDITPVDDQMRISVFNENGSIYELGIPSQFNKNFTVKGSDMDADGIANSSRLQYKFKSDDEAVINAKKGNFENITIADDNAADLTISKFKNVDIDLQGVGDSGLDINQAAQGDVITGSGDDLVDINTKAYSGFNDGFSVNTGAGDDLVKTSGSNSSASYNIYTGDGQDSVSLKGVFDSAVVDAGSGDDTIFAQTNNAQTTYDIDVGEGDDDITIKGRFAEADVNLGDGDDSLQVTGSINSAKINVDAEDGDDNLVLKGKYDSAEVDSGSGDDSLSITSNNKNAEIDLDSGEGEDLVTIKGKFSNADVDSGAGDDSVSITNKNANAEYDISTAAGNDDVLIKGKFGDVEVETGLGDDSITIQSSNKNAVMNIESAEGDDSVVLSGKYASADVDTGAGDDTVTINSSDKNADIKIDTGIGHDSVVLSGKYASAQMISGEGNDAFVSNGTGNDAFEIQSRGFGHDTFDAGKGNSDSILLAHDEHISISDTGENSWTISVDGQTATLTTDTEGVIVNNQLLFNESASGTLIMEDGSQLDFDGVESVYW